MMQSYKIIQCSVQNMETNTQTDDILIQQFNQFHNMKHQVTKTYVAIILIIYLLTYIGTICWKEDKISNAIFFGLIFILTLLIMYNKNTMQYAMFTNTTLNIIYHILYLTTIICLSIINICCMTNNYYKDNIRFWAGFIFVIFLIIKLILDTVIYFVYKDDYNNSMLINEDMLINTKTLKKNQKEEKFNKNESDTQHTTTNTVEKTDWTKEIIGAIILGIIIGIIRNFL